MLNICNKYIFLGFLTSLIISDNLILFFISWIGLNISLYGVLLKSFNSYNIEITLKYFVSGSIITIFVLFAMLLYFIDYFTFNFENLSYLQITNSFEYSNTNITYVSKYQKIYYISIITAILFKLGAFPFHFYISEMYESLNLKKAMPLYSISLKISIFLTLLKLLSNFWFLNHIIQDLLLCSGLGSIFISSVAMVKQYKIKKFLAYSYLNTTGYSLICLASSSLSEIGGDISFYCAKVYFFSYLLCWAAFLDILIKFKYKKRNRLSELYYISDLIYFNKKNLNSGLFGVKYYIICLTASLAGLPPLLGFFAKSILFFEIVSNNFSTAVFLFLLILTPLSSYGYLKIMLSVIIRDTKKTKYVKKFYAKKYKKNTIVYFKKKYIFWKFNYKNLTKILMISPIFAYIEEKFSILILF